jgi:hypothetical protein
MRVRAQAPPRPRAHPVLGSALDLRRSQIRTYQRAMRERGSEPTDVPLDTHGLMLRPKGAVPIQPAAR